MENISTGATFAQGHEMRLGQTLKRQSLTSPSGEFTLVHQDDGNLVLYRNTHWRALWSTGTDGRSAGGCVLREDGCLVVLGYGGKWLWDSGTAGLGVRRLVVRDDGDVVLEDGQGRTVWATHTVEGQFPAGAVACGDRMLPGQTLARQSLTCPSGAFVFTHQDDGNLVLYRDADGRALWTSGTGGSGTAGCVLGPDGELTVYAKNGQPVWSSGTSGHPGSRLLVHDNGRVVLRTPAGTDIWNRPDSQDAPGVPHSRVPQGIRSEPQEVPAVPQNPGSHIQHSRPVRRLRLPASLPHTQPWLLLCGRRADAPVP